MDNSFSQSYFILLPPPQNFLPVLCYLIYLFSKFPIVCLPIWNITSIKVVVLLCLLMFLAWNRYSINICGRNGQGQ